MLDVQIAKVATEPFTKNGKLPELVQRRDKGAVWHVRKTPVRTPLTEEALDWALVKDGDLVRIPILPYNSPTESPPDLIAAAAVISVACYAAYPEAKRILIVVGDPLEDLRPEQDDYRYWIGIGLEM